MKKKVKIEALVDKSWETRGFPGCKAAFARADLLPEDPWLAARYVELYCKPIYYRLMWPIVWVLFMI